MLTSVSSFSPPVPYQVFPNNIQRLSQHDSYALECFIKLNSCLFQACVFGILQRIRSCTYKSRETAVRFKKQPPGYKFSPGTAITCSVINNHNGK